ncbi:MAG: hypothetical protein NT069_24495, partial [Planctomycetota bacterium]|nr:hypothetical protein [Planctomycetota bacterium]
RQLADFDQFKESGEDKIVLAGIDRIGGETTVNVREWDAATRTLGLLQTRRTTDSRATSSLVLEALRAAFRPLVQIDQTKDGAVTLRGKSNLIPPHDPAWNPLREGMVFEPYYRYLNKERKVERITRVPWTYLVSGPPVPDEGRAPGIPISGLRTAISARRRRIEAVALG